MALYLVGALLLGNLVGTPVPSDTFDFGWPPTRINLKERVAGKKVVLLGLPGAFTPTWSEREIPEYLEKVDALKALGVDEVIAYAVNDGAVMDAWAEKQGVDQTEKGLLTLMGDPTGKMTRQFGMVMAAKGDLIKFGNDRSKRFALYIVDGIIKVHTLAENAGGADDPAGDNFPEEVMPDKILAEIKKLAMKDEI